MGYPTDGLGATEQSRHGHAPAHFEPGCVLGHRSHGALDHRSAAGEHGVTGVVGARPSGQRVGGILYRIHAHCAVALDGGGDVRQFRFDGLAVTGEEQMGQAHLVDTLALPAVPGFLGILGGRLRVPLDDGDQVAVAGEHHPQTEAHHPTTDHHDLGHCHTPRCSCYRCVYSTVTLLARLRG